MTHDVDDPSNWHKPAAAAFCIGLDVGMAQDHSALVVAGAWRSGARSVIGVFDIRQFALGAPLDDVADAAADVARQHRCRIVFDASNNSAFGSLLAARLGPNPANALVAGVITNALDHAAQPVPTMLSLSGVRTAIPRWTLSKRELIESISAEIDSGTLRIAHAGDWETLHDELLSMERTVRQSGSVAYSAPAGKHDDMVIALALSVFGLRRIGAPARPRLGQRERFSSAAWT
jgi:hypothetical protein